MKLELLIKVGIINRSLSASLQTVNGYASTASAILQGLGLINCSDANYRNGPTQLSFGSSQLK